MTTVPPPLTLTTIPELVLGKIIEKSGYKAIMSLRKVCHSLRDYIDQHKPEAKFKKIEIHLEDTSIFLQFQLENEPEDVVRYWKNDRNCILKFNQKDLLIENSTPEDLFFPDFQSIINFQKSELDRFLVYGREEPDDVIHNDFLEKIGKILKSQNLKTKEFFTDSTKQDQILNILPYLDPNFLKKFFVQFPPFDQDRENLEMAEIVKLEQWKHLEVAIIQTKCIGFPGIYHFLQLKEAVFMLDVARAEDLVAIKESFLRDPSMKTKFHVGYENYSVESAFDRIMGPPVIFNSEEERRWFIDIPNSEDLLFIFNTMEYPFYFEFSKFKKEDIQDVTWIQN